MNNNMIITSQYKDLNEFLAKHNAKNDKNLTPTHTRIGDKELNIYPGSYIIPKEDLNTFYGLYYDYVFVKKRKEYLTEKQLEDNCPMVVDFDFRYNYDVESRVHTKEHIQDMILLYLEELKEYFIFEENKPFNIFIFEKPNVNRLQDKSITKDGIHMLIGLNIDHTMQTMIRESMINKLQEVWESLPLINSWDSVLDEGISKGTTNWQLFGSRKPSNEAYELTSHFIITFDKNDGEFMMDEKKVSDFDLKNNFIKLSVQNDDNPRFEVNPKIIDLYNKKLEKKTNKIKRPPSKTKVNLIVEDDNSDENYISINDIVDKETLKRAVDNMLKNLLPSEYEIKETHEYTQILPEKYYEPGSHLLNRQVAFALKHTDERLFLSWIMLRSKASDFDYNTIPELYHDWNKYFKNKKDGVTRRSIMYWAKQDAYDEYVKVKNSTIDYYMEETLFTQTEFDIAQVLYQMYKDKYVCVSYEKKGTWYHFKNHRWEPDKGLSLRLNISKEMYNLYNKKQDESVNECQHYDQDDDRREYLKKKTQKICELMVKLKQTNPKNNIMREAMELFYDKDFIKSMDTNKYLLCFNNGVFDFKNKVFRNGYPQDYITLTTGVNYIPYDENNNEILTIGNEIKSFMNKLFPIPEHNRYMWDHLASCLIGVNKNQTFNVYHGSGSNGKSALTDLMKHTLGEYQGQVPITLVTEKRVGVGGTSSEVIQLKGKRYAVMQEPKKGMQLNEGVMKELTGGDLIQARALFCESETFQPQFKLVVCTNTLFDINSNDDGTWRRIRKNDFISKFIDEDDKTEYDTPYVYIKDKTLEERYPTLAPIFASMLVKRACETDGIVKDCDFVIEASKKYRKSQDHISAFINEMVVKTGSDNDKIKKTGLIQEFRIWFQNEQGGAKMPKGQELYDYMDKKFGPCKKTGWHGVKFLEVEDKTNDIHNLDD
jgi:P4 family phage/plasmid primase-like protien